jgi:probable phosphoglycerate mutase
MSASEEAAVPAETRLVLIRHGESNVSVDRVIGGARTCSGLSELGRLQAVRLRDRLADTDEIRPDVLIASHYARAIETAEIIAPALGGREVLVDEGFGEHDPGPELDGMPFDEYIDRFGMPDWAGDPHHEVFAGGETTAEFHLRVGAALSRVLREHVGGTIVVSCHGGVVDAVFRQLLNTPQIGGFALYTLNTSITEFSRPSRGHTVLLRYNDASHLAGLPAETPRTGG